MVNKWITIVVMLIATTSYGQKNKTGDRYVADYVDHVFMLTEVMFHDVINPPAAARFFSYATLAAQHVVAENFMGQRPLSLVMKQYPDFTGARPKPKIDPYFSAIYAMLETGKNIIPSGYSLQEKQDALYKKYLKQGVKRVMLDSSVAYAKRVSHAFVQLSKQDGYFKLSTLTRYQPKSTDSTWYPTPPEYMAAVEANWRTVKTFFMDSCQQFKPQPAVYFSSKKDSKFYALMTEVYETSKKLSDEQTLIAKYWDCNPFANFYSGHVGIAIKKISPGGHWMSITGIACKKANLTFAKTVQTHAVVALTLHDGFVSCWDEKYRSDRVRPKSAINKFIDERWNPLLETPPFPEYTSGHSVISTASATVLTHLIGDNFQFTDNTEVMFGLPTRTFNSFHEAANEAAISRMYGGIHFRDAIENGQEQGQALGDFIVARLKKLEMPNE